MNESAPLTEPDELNGDSFADELNGLVDEVESSMDEENEMTGIIEIPSAKAGQNDEVSDTGASSFGAAPGLRAAYRTSMGLVRNRNEDSCLIFSSGSGGHFPLLPFGLYIVADGMGGHANGHVASKTATRVAARHILDKIYLPLLYDAGGLNQTPIQEVMVDAVQAANTAVFMTDPESDSGTTLTIALVLGQRLHVAHVGDSRLYMWVDGRLEAVTNDHTLVQRMRDVGQPADDVMYDQIKHVVLRAVGQMEEVEVDTYMRLLPKNGKLLVCSDGLCGFVSDEEMQEIMNRDIDIETMADTLSDAAMSAGGYDNITAVIVDLIFE